MKSVEDELISGSNLEDVSNKLNLNLKKIKLLEKKLFFNSELPNEIKIDKFYKEVFECELNSNLFIEEIQDGFYVVEINEIIDQKEKTFEEAYKDIISDVKNEEINKKTKDKIKIFKKKLNDGISF